MNYMYISKIGKRRGFLFTLLVFVIFLFLFLNINIWAKMQKAKEQKSAMKIRSEVLHEFIKSAVRDANRFAYISATRAIFYADNYVIFNRTYLSNASSAIAELMLNGTIDGKDNFTYFTGENITVVYLREGMANATVDYWRTKIEEKGSEFLFNVHVNFTDFVINQSDPWNVDVHFTMYIRADDELGLISWEREVPLTVSVPIEYYEDPIFPIGTNGEIFRKIRRGNLTQLWSQIGDVGQNGDGWVYAPAFVIEDPNARCDDIQEINKQYILVVHQCETITNQCPDILNSFAGIICENSHASCVGGFNPICNITIPFIQGMRDARDTIPNDTHILLNGNYAEALNISLLREYASEGYYVHANYAPSFLKRLEGDLSNDPQGIESLVGSWGTKRASYVDYLYFNESSVQLYKIKGTFGCENADSCTRDYDIEGNPIWRFLIDNETALLNMTCAYIPSTENCTHIDLYNLAHIVVPV
ncbi:MAG: hypothetical protein QXP42_02140 [Candidatus Micrarchaeia archaeon]